MNTTKGDFSLRKRTLCWKSQAVESEEVMLMRKRLLGLCTALALCLSLLPTPVLAWQETPLEIVSIAKNNTEKAMSEDDEEFEPEEATLSSVWITVTFDANGGSFAGMLNTTQRILQVGGTYSTLPTPIRDGYRFDGWYTSPDCDLLGKPMGTKITADSTVSGRGGDSSLYAIWTKYDITFPLNDLFEASRIMLGQSVSVSFTFTSSPEVYSVRCRISRNDIVSTAWGKDVEWPTEENGDGKATITVTAENIGTETVYILLLDENENELCSKNFPVTVTDPPTVTFDANGGNVSPSSKIVTPGSAYGTLPTPTREGYIFDGWYTSPFDGTEVTESTIVPESYSILGHWGIYAHWKTGYTLDFSPTSLILSKGESKTVSISFTKNPSDIYALRYVLQPENTVSASWGVVDYDTGKTSLTVTGEQPGTATVYVALIAEDDTILFAKNFQVTVNNTFIIIPNQTVSFNANGGSVSPETQTVSTSGRYGNLPMPTRDGYTFDGWYTSATNGTQITSDSIVSVEASRTLYAHWAANTARITFDANGGSVSVSSKSVTTGEPAGELPTPTRSGYTFEGWYKSAVGGEQITADTVLTVYSDDTLYAHWTAQVSNNLQIEMGSASAFKGATVNVPVTIKNNPGISGAALTVSYDKSVLTLNSVQKGSVFATGTYSADTSTGVVIWYHTENITDNGTLFTLQFAVNSNAGVGRYPVTVGLREGKATNLTNADSASVSAEFLSGALEVMSGVRGDVTGDGDVAINDVVKVARAVARKITLTESERALADVTGDGFIAINDVVKLARYVAGSIASLQSVETATLADGASAVIEAATVNGKPGEIIRVPVSITSNPGIAGAQLDILFDNGLTLKNVIQGDVMSEGTFEPDVNAGMIQWYYDQANVTSTGVLFTLEFEVSAEAKNGDAYAITVNVTDGISANLSDYDSNPVSAEFKPGKIQISETADNTSITTVSRNGNMITVNVVCANSNASVFCGVYDNNGKMIAVRSVQVTSESSYQFQFDGQQFDYAKVFILDDNFRPLCEAQRR